MKFKITIDRRTVGFAPEEILVDAENITIKDGIFCFYNQGKKYHFCGGRDERDN